MSNVAAVLTDQGRIAIAMAVKETPNQFMAWGLGDGVWTDPPPPNVGADSLMGEVGRRRFTEISFALPNESGSISVPNGRFELTDTPTRWLYYRAAFEMVDASTATIREQGIFIDTVLAAGVPPDQWYLLPNQVQEPGRLLLLQNSPPIVREPSIRQFFEFIVSF